MSEPAGGRFSKVRIEMLCDGIFAIAMTLLVLELKTPELPRTAAPPEIWHALREHGGHFAAFVLTFVLASQFWLLHHQFFNHLRQANRAIALLTIPYLMFVSLLPFSTSMLAAFSLSNPVGLTFYFGNQLALALLLAGQWLAAARQRLLVDVAGRDPVAFGTVLLLQPASFAVSLAVVYIEPRQAMRVMAATQILIMVIAQRRGRRAAAAAAAGAAAAASISEALPS
jgi:TMEM175 potassium channel family protein